MCILFPMKMRTTKNPSKTLNNKWEILSTVITHLALKKVRFLLAYVYMTLPYNCHLPHGQGRINGKEKKKMWKRTNSY